MSPSSAPLPTIEGSPRSSESTRPRSRSLTEALRQAVTELGASAVGVTRADGGPAKYFTRNAQAAQFFEDVCTNGLQLLKAQTQTKGGVFGTNRVRADSNGPVRGRLIAVSLRSAQGTPLGTLVAVRLIDEDKFGSVESQKLLALGREFEALLTEERAASAAPAPESRSMWPADVKSAGVRAVGVQPVDVKPADVVPADVKSVDVKAVGVQPMDVKPADVVPADVKPAGAESADAAPAAVKPAYGKAADAATVGGKAAAPLGASGAAGSAPTPSSSAARAGEGARITDFGATTTTVNRKPAATTESDTARMPAAKPASTTPPAANAAAPESSALTAEHGLPPAPAAAAAALAVPTTLTDAPSAVRASAQRTPAPNEAATLAGASAPTSKPSAPATDKDNATPAASAAEAESYDPIATLLGWSEFERQIRTQESNDRTLPGCVIYGDIDQLHVINKLAGFAIGDLAISEVGAALQTAELPQGSCSCHLSGDRFTLYIPRTTLAQGRRFAEQLSKTVSGLSVTVHSVPTPLSISFGVALIPSNEGGLSHALAAAEAACKAAKDRGRGRVEVYQDADQSIVRRNDDVLVADRLRQALEAGRVDVFAQPIVRLNGTQSAANYELLVRLIGDAGTLLSPTWFMSAATRYRMLVELDRAVVGHVLAKLEAHRALLSCKNLRFSVNLSGPSIGDPDFLEWIVSRVGGAGVPGEWLQFEITEMAAVANIAQTQAMIRRLQSRGVQFALDDFGTGVSSFAYLKYFDVKMLKLDGSFVRDLLSNPRSESLVRGIAQLGRGMGIETVAECVETYEVRDRLADLGVDCAQGFLFGRPKPFDGVLANELGLKAVPNAAALVAKG